MHRVFRTPALYAVDSFSPTYPEKLSGVLLFKDDNKSLVLCGVNTLIVLLQDISAPHRSAELRDSQENKVPIATLPIGALIASRGRSRALALCTLPVLNGSGTLFRRTSLTPKPSPSPKGRGDRKILGWCDDSELIYALLY